MPNLGPTELIIILVIVLIIFGASRLPGLFRALGQGVKEFRDASKDPVAEEKPKERRKRPSRPEPGRETGDAAGWALRLKLRCMVGSGCP